MKIRLLDPGYEKFTGTFGSTEFVDGVSVDHVSGVEARSFAALMRIEDAETGDDPGHNALYQRSFELEAKTEDLPTLAQLAQAESPQDDVAQEPAVEQVKHTEESLSAIADKEGIAGLRKIAEPLGIKGTSITKLIASIIAKQNEGAPEAVTLPEGQPDVVTSENAE